MAQTLSASDAAMLLSDLKSARSDLNHRAAGLSLMMWALVATSVVGSLLIVDKIPHDDLSNAGWALFLLANVGAVAAWAAVGASIQSVIWRSFNTRPAAQHAWKAPALAAGAAFLLVALQMVLQGLVRDLQGFDASTSMEDMHHNLGFAFALGIGGSLIIAISILLGTQGYRRRPGILVGVAMMVVGHASAFLWVPAIGIAGVVIGITAVPVALLVIGHNLWRRG